MSETLMTNADPVAYPELRVGSCLYPVKITILTLVKLKQQGIDLFEQVPYDPQNAAHAALIGSARELAALPVTVDPEELERRARLLEGLKADVAEVEALMTPERRNWRDPLRRGTIIDQWEVCAKILAASVSTEATKISYMQLLEQIAPDQVNAMVDVLTEAIKKVSAQITKANP